MAVGQAWSESNRAATIEGARFDPAIHDNQRKQQAVDALAELARDIGITVPHLALAFVRAHPAVTAAIIGPRRWSNCDGLFERR